MSKWKLSDLAALPAGMVTLPPNLKRKTVKIKKESKAIAHIKEVLWLLKIEYEEEYIFHESRKWRFDFAFPEHKIYIEIEGIVSDKSRHTTLTGYTGDCDKYNAAAVLGWRGVRYTAMNYKNFYNDLKTIMEL